VKPFGPVHEYVTLFWRGVLSEIVPPAQTGPLLLAVGAAGIGLTATRVSPGNDVQPLTVMVTEYVPVSAVVELGRVGFCRFDVKPFGPVHE
jgi:hypothetical protein